MDGLGHMVSLVYREGRGSSSLCEPGLTMVASILLAVFQVGRKVEDERELRRLYQTMDVKV